MTTTYYICGTAIFPVGNEAFRDRAATKLAQAANQRGYVPAPERSVPSTYAGGVEKYISNEPDSATEEVPDPQPTPRPAVKWFYIHPDKRQINSDQATLQSLLLSEAVVTYSTGSGIYIWDESDPDNYVTGAKRKP